MAVIKEFDGHNGKQVKIDEWLQFDRRVRRMGLIHDYELMMNKRRPYHTGHYIPDKND